jgi:Pentapeptide repeats (8 copies)
MANDEHVALLKQGVAAWNAWREKNPDIRPDLSDATLGVNLSRANLSGTNLSKAVLVHANLGEADLSGAMLDWADLSGADLSGANLLSAQLMEANVSGANLSGAHLYWANLTGANLNAVVLFNAELNSAELIGAKLSGANLSGANLTLANLTGANLTGANLSGAYLRGANLVSSNLTDADLTGCRIYGVSAWELKLERAKQQNLIITRADEPEITVDNIEVAQFVYLLLHNEKIRDVLDTIGKKAVLILGRFTDERKAVLDALREELRKRDYLPILFDFAVPATRDITETVSLLARMARFIIADLTDPSSIPKELEAIVPGLAVPVQPLLEGASRPYAMFKDYWKYDWVLPVYRYEGLEPLLATLADKVIAPAEAKAKALQERRRMFEAELTKPQ